MMDDLAYQDEIELSCEILSETDKAILIDSDAGEIWLPKSQIELPEEYGVGDSRLYDVLIPGWLARKKGLL